MILVFCGLEPHKNNENKRAMIFQNHYSNTTLKNQHQTLYKHYLIYNRKKSGPGQIFF